MIRFSAQAGVSWGAAFFLRIAAAGSSRGVSSAQEVSSNAPLNNPGPIEIWRNENVFMAVVVGSENRRAVTVQGTVADLTGYNR
ncbi:MAG: hypothetical protein P1V20_21900 [Verrucomicrobiales bacterium]|nr:hypothetical protein [Verrucomicrobiales bacterium]